MFVRDQLAKGGAFGNEERSEGALSNGHSLSPPPLSRMNSLVSKVSSFESPSSDDHARANFLLSFSAGMELRSLLSLWAPSLSEDSSSRGRSLSCSKESLKGKE